jgi:hypothetical protein
MSYLSNSFPQQPFTVLVPNTPDDPAYQPVPPSGQGQGSETEGKEQTSTWNDYSPYNFTQSGTADHLPNVPDPTPTVVSLDESGEQQVQYVCPTFSIIPSTASTLQQLVSTPALVTQPLSSRHAMAISQPLNIPLPQGVMTSHVAFPAMPSVVPSLVLPAAATTLTSLTPQQLSTITGANTTLVPSNMATNMVSSAATNPLPPPVDSNTPASAPQAPTGDCHWINITNYLNLPQSEAAKKLNIPTSSLSKRWKESARKRKWPYRAVCKLDKEIMTLMHNIPPGSTLPPDIEEKLSKLLRERQEMLKPVVIRL